MAHKNGTIKSMGILPYIDTYYSQQGGSTAFLALLKIRKKNGGRLPTLATIGGQFNRNEDTIGYWIKMLRQTNNKSTKYLFH